MSFTNIVAHLGIYLMVITCLAPNSVQSQTLQTDDPMLRKCEKDWWCSAVAQPPSPWPEPYDGKTVEIVESPRLLVGVPANLKRIVHSDYIMLVTYEDNKQLTFEVSSEGLFRQLFPPLMKDVHLTMLDFANIMFTKTAKDKEPEITSDLLLWRFAINMKSQLLSEKTPVFSARKGPLTCYYWHVPPKDRGAESTAILVNDDNPYAFLKIVGHGMSFGDFKRIIGNIREKNK